MASSQNWAHLLIEAGYEVVEYPRHYAIMEEDPFAEHEGDTAAHEEGNDRSESGMPAAPSKKSTYHRLRFKIVLTIPKCDKLVSAVLDRIKALLNR